jgi:hypothetical protein
VNFLATDYGSKEQSDSTAYNEDSSGMYYGDLQSGNVFFNGTDTSFDCIQFIERYI